MCKKLIYLTSPVLLLVLAGNTMAQLDPTSVTDGHVYLFENVGGDVPDDSANTHTANLIGNPQVVDGLIGKALQFNGTSDGVHIPDATMVNLSTHQNRTVVAVFKCDDVYKTDKQVVYEEGGTTRGLTIYVHEGLVYAGGWNKADYDPQWNPGTFISAPISSNAWYTVAMVVRDGGAGQEDDKFEMWMNGELIGIGPGAELRRRSDDCAIGYQNSETTFHDGIVTGGGSYFEGIVDEIWMINDALTETEMDMVGKVWPYASGPNPTDGAKYVNPNVELSWSSGFGAQLHIVYFGDNFDDVNHDAGGFLLETKTYIPGPLELDKVYYWRVNEFDGVVIHKGEVWSFRTLPEIDPNLIGGWKFDEGSGTIAYDSSGNGNDGTLEDGPTVVDGQFGQALAFEGSRVAIPASDSLTADLFQGSFTLSAWINPKRTGGTWQQIFRSMIADDTSNDTLFINNDGRLSWRGRIGGDWAGGMCETSSDVVPADQWTHVAVVGDGMSFRIYVNGALSQESAFQTTDGSNATYYLGGDPTWIGESYSGIIDDVRIYNVALTAEEIEALAQ